VIALLLGAALADAIVPIAAIEQSMEDPCAISAGSPESPEALPARFTIDDLVTLADIGRDPARAAGQVFSLSPDGKRIALHIERANPKTNSFCQRLVVLPLDGRGDAIEVDRGGEFLRDDFSLRDFPMVRAGYARANPPRWSADGKRIAFLKRVNSSTQVWLASSDGKDPALQVSYLPDDADEVQWNRDGSGLIIATRPDVRVRAEQIAREASRGFLYDERFSPQFSDRPIPVFAIETQHVFLSLRDGKVRPATISEAGERTGEGVADPPRKAAAYVSSPAGASAWLEPKYPERLVSQRKLVVLSPTGQQKVCDAEICEGLTDLWWSADGRSLFGLQFTGWADNQMGFLRWNVDDDRPRQWLISDDVFASCALVKQELVCVREGSARPRRIVAINVETGAERLVFDPNLHVAQRRMGSVQRLLVRSEAGSESFADLVLPPDHQPGQKHPLVVVQYMSHGFLRGGTGDEVPIHPLANRGFAVLSFSRPQFPPEALAASTDEGLSRANRVGWADRRNVHSALERAVQAAIDTGAVDPARLGISGFSDGGTTTQWALINSDLFRVAALGSCCEDMSAYALSAGPRFTRLLRDIGYPLFEPGSEDFWKPISLVLNVDRVTAPILIQNVDSEYEGGLDVVETYRHRGRAIELHVFPDETHVKWQPAHRQAMYERYVEWFEFWLMNRVNCSADREPQYARWKAMAGAPAKADLRCDQ
jgi:dipeptidyl aminopeptidase/acylaminoacyl peptidase